jgi:beta-glucosidase-like glycosyl hydrolase
VLSDLGAINMMFETHHTAASPLDAVVQFLTAGGNMQVGGVGGRVSPPNANIVAVCLLTLFRQFYDYPHAQWDSMVMLAVTSGVLNESIVDDRVADVLRVKMMLGLFDNPMTGLASPPSLVVPLPVVVVVRCVVGQDSPSSPQTQRSCPQWSTLPLTKRWRSKPHARPSFCSRTMELRCPFPRHGHTHTQLIRVAVSPDVHMLTSLRSSLSLSLQSSALHSIAVIGPSADTLQLGDYAGFGVLDNFITTLEGITAKTPQANIYHAWYAAHQSRSAPRASLCGDAVS